MSDGLFYRFLPKEPGKLHAGGRLQALKIKGQARADTRNFSERAFPPRAKAKVEWLDIKNVQAPDDDLRYQGFFERGAARFARGEGIWFGQKELYFACTNGGRKRKGQIWRYTPSSNEGKGRERWKPGTLELYAIFCFAAIVIGEMSFRTFWHLQWADPLPKFEQAVSGGGVSM